MRTLLILAALAGLPACTGTSPTPSVDTAEAPDATMTALTDAVAAWEAAPGEATLTAVSKAARPANELPPGSLERDRVIAHALTHVLLRPDLGLARLEPHEDALEGDAAMLWLESLLRRGDLARFSAASERLYGRTIDPKQPALGVAAQHAVRHREIGVAEAWYAHDAGRLAEKQITYGRRSLNLPMPDLARAMEVLDHLLPGWRLELVTTRAALPADPDLLSTPGALPATRSTRRILGYATSDEDGAIERVAAALHADPPLRTAGYVVEATSPEGRTIRLCSEGKFKDDTFWLISACEPERASAWLQALDAYADLVDGGMDPAEAGETVRGTWGPRVQAAPDAP